MFAKLQLLSPHLLLSLSVMFGSLMLQTKPVQAANLTIGSTLQFGGSVQITTASTPGDTLLFWTKDASGNDIAVAPMGSYGNYSIQTGPSDGSFDFQTSNSSSYQIASINQHTAIPTPFLRVGSVAGVGNVTFNLTQILLWQYSGLPGRASLTILADGVFVVDGTNTNLGVGSFSSQFINLGTLPTNRSYSGTFEVAVVPEPGAVAGILCFGLMGMAATKRNARSPKQS
jgi:hypothetical protein